MRLEKKESPDAPPHIPAVDEDKERRAAKPHYMNANNKKDASDVHFRLNYHRRPTYLFALFVLVNSPTARRSHRNNTQSGSRPLVRCQAQSWNLRTKK